MKPHPLNLALRFLLELAAISAMSLWGFRHGTGSSRFFYAAIAPLIAAGIWGMFAVPGDPSRSGSAPVPVRGLIRLGLETGFFSFAVWCLARIGWPSAALVLGIITAVHYSVSYDRIRWLLRA